MEPKTRIAGIAIAGATGVGIGFGLGYLAFRRPAAKVAEPKAPELSTKDEPKAALPAAPPTAPPQQIQPPSQAPANQQGAPQPVQAGGLQGLLNGLLGGGGNAGFAGGLGTNESPAPPQQDAVQGAPPAPAYTPQAPLGTRQNPVIIPRGFNI